MKDKMEMNPPIIWHQEVASYPFCLLVNSSWLLVLTILLFYLLLSVFNFYLWNGIHFPMSLYLVSTNVFLIWVYFLIYLNYWFRDLIREYYKKYEVLFMVLFIVFLIFVFSEAMLFVSFFWASFHSSCSPSLGIWPQEGLYVPDPCELTYANTLLLSNAAVSLGCAFIIKEIYSSSMVLFSLISFVLAWTFISLQIKEFRNMGFSINDSVYSSVFFFLTGLHFFHVVVGIILISILFYSSSYNCKINIMFLLRISPMHLFYNLQLIYWHFVEGLWLFIYMVLYSY